MINTSRPRTSFVPLMFVLPFVWLCALTSCSTRDLARLDEVAAFITDTTAMVKSNRELVSTCRETLQLSQEIQGDVKALVAALRSAAEENRLAMVAVHEMAGTLSALRAMVVELTSAVGEMRVALKTR